MPARRLILCFAVGLMELVASLVPAAAQDPGSEEFFEKRVRPVLSARCFRCHGGERVSGGLRIDSLESLRRGGESGSAIDVDQPKNSLLLSAIRREESFSPMPPDQPLHADVVADLTAWIEAGTFWPENSSPFEVEQHWAYQPVRPVDVPDVQTVPRPQSEIDRILSSSLEVADVVPAPVADSRTLIRRATYDLTGLPPTPEEIDAFLADDSPDAFAQLIERLLASPQYGVKWGRHWLDVVRYADTAGENTDRPLPHAWRYRNWVIDAFNRDLPFDEFVKLQIAGDVLRADEQDDAFAEGIVATGYLAIARRFGHDIDKDMHLTHEDVIDNLGKNFLGMTLGCARCHDHKYDSVTIEDYYALYGIFESTRFAFPGCEPKGQPRDLVPLIPRAEAEEMRNRWRASFAEIEAEVERVGKLMTAQSEQIHEIMKNSGRLLAAADVGEGANVSLGDGAQQPLDRISVNKGDVIQLTVLPNDNHGADSTLVELEIKEVGGDQRQWSVDDLIDHLLTANPHPGSLKQEATWCFLETGGAPVLLLDPVDSIEQREELKAWRRGELPSVFVNTSTEAVDVWTSLPPRSVFVHPGPNKPVSIAWIAPLEGTVHVSGRVADVHPAALDGVAFRLEHFASKDLGPAWTALGDAARTYREVVVRRDSEIGTQPEIPVAYAVVEAEPTNSRLHERGDPKTLGDEIPRRWLSLFGGDLVPEDAGSGREHLAEWVSRHPLAARVMVNRIWQYHFGSGIVRTPNDFGVRGESPTHPDLLEWLTARFIESGYSVKEMHRLIMKTDAYRRASNSTDAMLTGDPENRLLSRFSRRRLTAEEIRDSLLFVGGHLDFAPGGPHPFPPEDTWRFTQHNPFAAVYDTNKRSAYLMVQRTRRHPFLALFDGADPNASTAVRQSTTLPTQALYFLNDPFFHEQAEGLSRRLTTANDVERIRAAFRIVFQRTPTEIEIVRGKTFIADYPSDFSDKRDAWSAYMRILLASNEFLYLD